MAGELLANFVAGDLYRETSKGYELAAYSAIYQTANGASRGVSLQKFIQAQLLEYYNYMTVVPAAIALATGLTFRLIVTDDGLNTADLGTAVRLSIIPYNLSTALSMVDYSLPASKGTETAATVTLGATTGLPVIGSIPIANAGLASLAAGNVLGIRIRRVGDNAADTCQNRIILHGGTITNT
jgi:hypothetical protein